MPRCTTRWRIPGRGRRLCRGASNIQGVELGGRIYYVGGLAAWPPPGSRRRLRVRPPTLRPVRLSPAPMPRPRGAGGVAAHDGKIYYAGGLSDGGRPWFDVYDPSSDSWSRLPDMPRARDHFHAVVADGKLYAIGGRDSELGRELAATDVYDFATGTWSSAAPIPTPRGGPSPRRSSATRSTSSAARTRTGAFATVEAYDVRQGTWRAADPLPVGRHGIQAVVCGGAIYVAAGGRTQGGESPSNLHDAYFTSGARGCGPPTSSTRVESPSFREHALKAARPTTRPRSSSAGMGASTSRSRTG